MKLPESLMPILEDLPEEEREEAARNLTRYLEVVIAIADEVDVDDSDGLTDGEEPPTLSYSV